MLQFTLFLSILLVFGLIKDIYKINKQKKRGFKMTKKHFIELTRVISQNVRYDGYNDYCINYKPFLKDLMSLCKESNSLFNEDQFKKAIKLKSFKSNNKRG